jgi:hypothetical protein
MNNKAWPPSPPEVLPEELPIAAKTADPEPPAREKPKRLPPNITPEPA